MQNFLFNLHFRNNCFHRLLFLLVFKDLIQPRFYAVFDLIMTLRQLQNVAELKSSTDSIFQSLYLDSFFDTLREVFLSYGTAMSVRVHLCGHFVVVFVVIMQ